MIRILVFATGAILMSLEMLGSRLLAPQYGNSIIVWASLISVFLAALATGYWLGGRLADRWRNLAGVALTLAGAGVLVAAVPLLAPLVFRMAGEEPRAGSLLSSFGLFFLPTMLMAAVSPWAVRLHHDGSDRLGRTAGGLYAISTIGSIVGTIVTAFWLIPSAGVTNLTRGLGIALLVLSLAVELSPRLVGAAAVGAAVILIGMMPARTVPNRVRMLVEKDTRYQHMRVYDSDGTRYLKLNNKIQSASAVGNPLLGRLPYTSYLHLPMAMNPRIRDVLFIGLGGGTVPLQFLHDYPNARIDVAELDSEVIDVARRYFGLPSDSARLRVVAEDGRRFLEHTDRTYDLIVIDAYHADFIPFHLTTRELFQLCSAKLRPGGQIAINVIGPYGGPWSGIVGSVWQTLGTAFSERSLYAVGNSARPDPLLRRNCELIAGSTRYASEHFPFAADYVANGPDLRRAIVLSDDFAPVEDLLRYHVTSKSSREVGP